MSDLSEADDLTGFTLADRYTIERELGRGGMATVWLASDARHDRAVAIKTLLLDNGGRIATDRFLRELRLTAALQHPNIVPVLDSGVLTRRDGTDVPWYAMPYLHGETLRARMSRGGQLPISEALRITESVGSALDLAHRSEVVHRDIKPENILLNGEQVYVLDFGIAKALGAADSDRITTTGLAVGTPAYMSPEQSVAGVVDARTDQYSLAAVLYEMVTGEPPFTGSNTQSIIARRIAERPRPLRTVRPAVPEALELATLRALERAPADRFESVAGFIAALRESDHQHRPPAARRLALNAAGIIAAIVVLAIAAWALLPGGRERTAPAVSAEVLALYERGIQAYERRTPAGVADGIATLRAALSRDSAFAPAWNALAKAYVRAHVRSFEVPDIPSEQLMAMAAEAVARSLRLDSTSADAWLTQSLVSERIDPTDGTLALRAVRRSIALDSTKSQAWHYLALSLTEKGEMQPALDAWRRAVRLEPANPEWASFLAVGHYSRHSFDSATVWADSAISLDPTYLLARQISGQVAIERGDFVRAEGAFDAARRLSTEVDEGNAFAWLAAVKARNGRGEEARADLRRADSITSSYHPIPLHNAVYLAQGYFALGDTERGLDVLRRYQPLRDAHYQLHLRCDPPFAGLANEPRFRALVVVPPPVWGRGC